MSYRVAAIGALLTFLLGLTLASVTEMKVFLPALLVGAKVTIQVAVLSSVIFFILSILSGVGKTSEIAPIRWLSTVYIEIFRGTSLLVQLFWLFFVLPEFGVVLSPFVAGVLGVGLNMGAYGGEVIKGAILAVPKGQYEASKALNMPRLTMLRRIVIPQALVVAMPSMTNLTIELLKATSLVSAVTLVDITFASVLQNQLHFRTVEIFSVTLILFYCFSQLIRFGAGSLEARVKRHMEKVV